MIRKNRNVLAFAAAVIIVIGAFAAQAALLPQHAKNFVPKISAAGLFEIQSSKLALDRSQNDSVRDFAQRMIDDHAKAGDQLKSVVAANNLDASWIADAVDSKHQRWLDKLAKLNGADFDKEYLADQVSAHNDAVGLFKDYADKGDNAALKDFATQTLPTLQQHQQMAKDLKSGYKTASAAATTAPASGQ
jgi:putative membrane protein